MSAITDCCTPCSTTPPVNVPGPAGADGAAGANGADGINAFTATTGNFVVPLKGVDVAVNVVSSSWMTVGQAVYVQGAGYFTVTSKPTTTSALLNYINTGANGNTGTTILTGATVSPSGPSVSALPTISTYQTGGAQAVTTVYATIISATVTLATAGTYLLFATARFDLSAATFSTSKTLSAKLARTNNTPADVTNAIATVATGTPTLTTGTLAYIPLPAVQYTASAGDTIELQAVLSGAAYAGAVNAVEASILAVQLF